MTEDDLSRGHPGGAHGGHGHPHDDAGSTGHPGGHPGRRDLDRTPLVVTWEVTQACDLECDHCRASAQPDRDPAELTTEGGKSLIDAIARFGHPAPVFVLTGGDPLKRPDVFELVEYATDRGLHTAVTPASTPLLTKEAIERFADLGVRRIALSLDGATAEAHDAFRGEAGSFETIRRAARWAKAAGMGVQINSTVTARTVDDLPAIADLVEGFGAAMWEVFFLVPIGRGESLAQLEPERTVEVMEWLYERQRDAPYRLITVEAPHYRRVADRVERATSGRGVRVGSTRAGKGFVFVSYEGEVYPSGFLPVSAGNVADRDFVDIYRNSDLFRRLRDEDELRGSCGECEYRALCGGSRSRAHAVTGDPFASDPLCPWVADLGVDA